jgi:hypothetical protein
VDFPRNGSMMLQARRRPWQDDQAGTTARHLRSLLAGLAPGRRLVAITDASCAQVATVWAKTFGRLIETARRPITGAP